jgi:hypothetical protein
MMTSKSILREPLLLFLAAGGLLYATYAILHPASEASADAHEIRADRKALLEFMQYRSKAFEPALFDKRFDEMSDAERTKLINEFVEEEVLYREAMSLGLQEGDYIIRQRMIQKMKFLIDEAMEPSAQTSPLMLETFYKDHASDYAEPPIYTFTQVFYDAALRTDPHADAIADAKQMNAAGAKFNDALNYGDRPLYFQNYVERTRDFVISHFDEEMIAAIDRLQPSEKVWYGPFKSQYGWHIVMLLKRDAGRVPPLSEIHDRVLNDYRVRLTEDNRKATIARLVRQYRVQKPEPTPAVAAQIK